MIEIQVLSKLMAEYLVFDDNTLIISISSPGSSEAKITGKYVFKFAFHDVREDLMVESNRFSGIMNAMNPAMAEAIVEVLMNHRHLTKWVIHCEAGISRSPGVAIGLARYISVKPDAGELIKKYPCANNHVRKLIEKALRDKITKIDEEIKWDCI